MSLPPPYAGSQPYLFVSYAHADAALVQPEMQRLATLGARYWYDEGITPGNAWREDIAAALAGSTTMVFFVTPRSVVSRHCQQEVSFCHSRGIRLLAVHLEPTELPLALELSLGDQQGILRYKYDDAQYTAKLADALGHLASTAPPAAATTRDAELKQVSILHLQLRARATDAEPVDPESWLDAISRTRAVVLGVVAAADARLTESGKEELVVCFGAPHTREDDLARALRTGLEALDAAASVAAGIAAELDLQVDLRAAVQTGPAVVSNSATGQPEVAGQVTTEAAALCQASPWAQLLVADAVARRTRGRFNLSEAGAQDLGSGSAAVYRVLDEVDQGPLPRQDQVAALRGREMELQQITARWQQAANGAGQAVLLSGDPGIGKTRLTLALIAAVRATPGQRVVVGGCAPHYQHTALHPFADILHDALARQGVSGAAALPALDALLAEYGLDDTDAVRLVANLLGIPHPGPVGQMSAERERQVLTETLLNLACLMAEDQPTLLVLEDLHWADPSTLELLGQLLELVPGVPLMLLLNHRPEFEPPWPVRPHILPLALAGLAQSEARTLVAAASGGQPLSAELEAAIIERAGGVPLFLEEVTKSVLARGDGDHSNSIPDTLQDTLAARLDTLEQEKPVAQLASVIGREFSMRLLAAVSDLPEDVLARHLAGLVHHGFLYQKGVGRQSRYTFKHALIRDSAYGSLLKMQRRLHHRAIAEALVEQFPAEAERRPELVAQHFTAVKALAEAYPWWVQAADAAVRQSAGLEAEHHLRQALACVPGCPEAEQPVAELGALMRLVPVLVANEGYAAAELGATCERALMLADASGDLAQTAFVLYGLWMFHVVRANHDQSLALSERVAAAAHQVGDADLMLEADITRGLAHFFVGRFGQARDFLDNVRTRYDPQAHGDHCFRFGQDPWVIAHSYLAWIHWIGGDDAAASAAMATALEAAERLGHPVSHCFALSYAGFLELYRNNPEGVERFAGQLVDLARREHIPIFRIHGEVQQAWLRAQKDGPQLGAAALADAIGSFRATGSRCFLHHWDALHAEQLAGAGAYGEAQALLDDALVDMQSTGERWAHAEVLRIRAAVQFAADGDTGGLADRCRAAITAAKAQGAVQWARRAEDAMTTQAAEPRPSTQ